MFTAFFLMAVQDRRRYGGDRVIKSRTCWRQSQLNQVAFYSRWFQNGTITNHLFFLWGLSFRGIVTDFHQPVFLHKRGNPLQVCYAPRVKVCWPYWNFFVFGDSSVQRNVSTNRELDLLCRSFIRIKKSASYKVNFHNWSLFTQKMAI